jgi:guanine nucleotide-binding protein subunit alpha
MHRRALAGKEKVLGVDHPDTLTSVNNLAVVLRNQGKYGEAESMSGRALAGTGKVLGVDHPSTLTSVSNLRGCWGIKGSDGAVQKIIADSHEYILNETLTFFFQGSIPMFDPSWMPNDQDMLHARMKTTGITETIFELGALTLRMVDVGGQRSEQKKWIHCFDGVNCLLFVASLSGYDQCLVEDVNANQMCEALALFNSVIQSEWFKDKPVILFLNKVDLFRNKLAISPLSAHFPDYVGRDDDEENAKAYFADKFKACDNAREIYIHFTNATDTSLLRTTMHDVQSILMRTKLQGLPS